MIAFSLIGYVKLIINYEDIGPVMATGGSVTLAIISLFSIRIFRMYQAVAIIDINAEVTSELSAFDGFRSLLNQFDIAASSASFVAG